MRGDLPAGTVTVLSPTSSRTLQLKARRFVTTAMTTFVGLSGRRSVAHPSDRVRRRFGSRLRARQRDLGRLIVRSRLNVLGHGSMMPLRP
jgi:hypothetical protein